MSDWRHWRLAAGEGGNLELFLAVDDRSVNVLHSGVLDELEDVLEHLYTESPPGVILGSDPERAFAMGADVTEFAKLENRDQALAMLHRGQKLFEDWANLECPTVAAIRGHCLGGGLELALACDYRIVESEPQVQMGLPEVRLGIHPGYGGSVRLPALVGDLKALRMMVTGKTVSGAAAMRLRLVDAVVPRRQLYAAAREMIRRRPAPYRPSWRDRLPHVPALRGAVTWAYARGMKSAAPEEHFPAPYRLLKHWQDLSEDSAEALESEAQSVANLFESPQARQMTRIFLLRQELKSHASNGKTTSSVHVVGTGVMGGDIAIWCALNGLRVTLQDTDPKRIAPVIRRARRMLDRRPEDTQATLDRLIPDPEGHGAGSADLVIEAIPENLEAKQELYCQLQSRMRPDALLATNTSSLPLEGLAEVLDEPTRLVGIHFFNPVSKMPLVEVIYHDSEQQSLINQAAGFVRHIRRVPLVVKSSPGFLVNRVLMPYLLEAVRLREEGMSVATIDRAATEFGMPMGPLKLADMVGLDVCLAAGSVLAGAHGAEIPGALAEAVEAGNLGRKTGRGFYHWKNGEARRLHGRKPPQDCGDRLVLSMVREAVHCLHEGLVERADWIDAGLILGTGFAPFTGGPLQLVRQRGMETVRRRLEVLEKRCGPRFAPGPGWDSEHLRKTAP